MALVSHECETGLYLTKCRKEFIFVKQDLLENLPQRFLHRADVAFPTAAHPRGSLLKSGAPKLPLRVLTYAMHHQWR
ncbi:hypothetical protein T03_6107 [Trichinella britovi]|uniref:Uncharacterized protein n=1 Tax=Trichinella britovi TaxID=45882 RepID=A0A0V1DCR3_TRIBR|nr:hypothetical protein T03_6107 [Trichinella britovi]